MQSVEPAEAPDASAVAVAEPAVRALGPTANIGQESGLEAGRSRDRVLERLLVILNSAALVGVGADFRDLGTA